MWKAATNTARMGPTLGSSMGMSPLISAMLQASGQYSFPGQPNWGPGSGMHAMMQDQSLLPWGTGGAPGTNQDQMGGMFGGQPFFPTTQGGRNGYEAGSPSNFHTSYDSMGNTRPYISANSPVEGYGPSNEILMQVLNNLAKYKPNPMLGYPGYSSSGFTGSGGGVQGVR